MACKRWTYKEIKYLTENYGNVSVRHIAKKLNRSINAILLKKNRLKIGKFTDNANNYITLFKLRTILKIDESYLKKLLKHKFPLDRIKNINNYTKIIYIDKLLKWLNTGNNKHLVNFANCEKGDIYAIEPEWFEDKRKSDKLLSKYNTTKWTEEENKKLICLLKQYRYSYTDLSKILNRYETAIKKQITQLKIKERPLIANKHIKWTYEQIETVKNMYKKGYHPIIIREFLKNKSQLAINGLLERHNYFLN